MLTVTCAHFFDVAERNDERNQYCSMQITHHPSAAQMAVIKAIKIQCWLAKTTRGYSKSPQLSFIGQMLAFLHFISLNVHETNFVLVIMFYFDVNNTSQSNQCSSVAQ